MKKNEFIEMVTVVNGQTRETLAVSPLAVGDVLKLTKSEPRDVNGNKFVALLTDDEQMISANQVLRSGNGINFGTKDLKAAAEKLFDAVNSASGLTLTIAKTYKSTSATGNIRNNYRFNAISL